MRHQQIEGATRSNPTQGPSDTPCIQRRQCFPSPSACARYNPFLADKPSLPWTMAFLNGRALTNTDYSKCPDSMHDSIFPQDTKLLCSTFPPLQRSLIDHTLDRVCTEREPPWLTGCPIVHPLSNRQPAVQMLHCTSKTGLTLCPTQISCSNSASI